MAQSLSCLHVHLIFSTKERASLISDAIRDELHAYTATVLHGLDCEPRLVNSMEDHVHALFDLARTRCVSDVVKEIKTSSSKWIKTKGSSFAKFAWQNGYAAFAVSVSNTTQVRSYIANQHEHHRDRTFQDELRRLLERHNVLYDERYVWD